MDILTAQVNQNMQGVTGNSLSTNIKTQAAPSRARGGMSVAERNKVKEMYESVERIDAKQKEINKALRSLGVEEIKGT